MKEIDFKWTADLVKDFCEYAGLRIGKKEDIREQLNYLIEDFKESHTEVKRDWEVVSAEKNGWIHKWNDFYAHHTQPCSKVGCNIHSVRRNSDGIVFSVGDEVETNGGRGRHIITEFKIFDGDVMCVGMKGFPVYYEFLSRISKPLQRTPLLITDDEVSLYNRNDKYWRVYDDWSTGLFEVSHPASYIVLANFASEDKAKEYVILNKPFMSVQLIMDRLHSYFSNPNDAFNNLKQMAQQKLDKQ